MVTQNKEEPEVLRIYREERERMEWHDRWIMPWVYAGMVLAYLAFLAALFYHLHKYHL